MVWTACAVCVSRAFDLKHCPDAVLTRAQALHCWDEGQKTKELFWQGIQKAWGRIWAAEGGFGLNWEVDYWADVNSGMWKQM